MKFRVFFWNQPYMKLQWGWRSHQNREVFLFLNFDCLYLNCCWHEFQSFCWRNHLGINNHVITLMFIEYWRHQKRKIYVSLKLISLFFLFDHPSPPPPRPSGNTMTNKTIITLNINSWKRHRKLNLALFLEAWFSFVYLIKHWSSNFEDDFGVTEVDFLSAWNFIICFYLISYWHITIVLLF